MILIGLTGGFATGKSTLAKFFKKKGAAFLSADRIYHELLLKDSFLKRSLVEKFGKDILQQGRVSRRKLKQRLLNNPGRSDLKALSRIVHPYIIKHLKKRIASYEKKAEVLIVEVPLLFEAKLDRLFDKITLVNCPLKLQLKRAIESGYTKKQVINLIREQLPLEKKIKRADFVIENTGTLKELKKKADVLYQKIIGS
ncbi:MAG: dephospho-CoA kinase [Candidatus Omnitrophica bacterium]|nr:dephospho-CoA kinase [Candidatus Omnitrophota bacterium]